jgi:TPR repeat protein
MISGNAPSPSAVKAPTTWHPAKGWTPECDPDDYGTCSQRCTKDRRPGSCFLAGLYASSAEHLLSACTAGIGAACVALAEIEILTPAGRDRRAAQRLEQVDRLVNQGCASDFGSACYAAGQLSRIFWKDGRDRSLFERGCRLESGGSCVFVAHDQLGRGNKLGAIETLQRGCRNWNGDACRELAEMLDRGDGVPAQHYLALRLYQRACAAGDDSSCPRYADLQLVQRAARLLGQADFNGRSCAAGSSGCREAVGSPR